MPSRTLNLGLHYSIGNGYEPRTKSICWLLSLSEFADQRVPGTPTLSQKYLLLWQVLLEHLEKHFVGRVFKGGVVYFYMASRRHLR